MSVHRLKPLPEGPAVGRLVVSDAVGDRTLALLRAVGMLEPPHEGMVWWLGRNIGTDTVVLACHAPRVRSGPQFVMADEAATGGASIAARARRLGVVAQVHSHPGADTRHSDGDDDLILMPYEGMFSVVVATYGAGHLLPELGAGIHQFQEGRWVLVRQAEPSIVIVPTEITA